MADKETVPECEKEVKTDSTDIKTAEKEVSPKSSPSKIETNEALQHLVQGKRHLLVRDVNSAVNSLQEACRLLAEQYGETADPCGEAYFFYGKALLELSRMETGVLGNALDGVPEGDDADTSQTEDPDKLSEEERMKVVEEVDEALEENFITLEKVQKSKESHADGEKDESAVVQTELKDAKQNGEVEMEAGEESEKIVDNEVDMEAGGSNETSAVSDKPAEDSGKPESVEKAAAGEESTEKTAPEPTAEAMEVDGAALSTAGGDAAPATDSAVGDGQQRPSSDFETTPAAAEKAADGAGGDGTAGAEVVEKSGTAGEDKLEEKPIPVNEDGSDSKPVDETTTVEDKNAGVKEIEKATNPATDISADNTLSDTAAEKTPVDATAKDASADTPAESGSEGTPAEKSSEDITAEQAPGDAVGEAADDAVGDMATDPAAEAEKTAETTAAGSSSDATTAETTDKLEKDLSNKKPGESTEGDEEDDDEAEGDGEEQPAEDAASKAEAEGETKEGDSDTAEGEEGKDAKEGDTSQDCDTEEGEVEGEGDGAKEGEDEEDVPNIQLAWEVLELAKIIFTRQAKDKASDLKLSEVFQKLGEVSIEAENYSQAVDDLGNCLAIQKKHLEADDRLIAETHYHLGVGHSLANQYSEAIAAFQASVDTILARVQRLQRQILDREQGKKIEHEDPFYKEENEIKELEDLLPDMKEKIADMRDMKTEAQKKIAEIFAASGGAGPSTSAAPISPVKAMMTSRPATSAADGDGEKKETHSIGHLVKRKRLSNEPTDEESKRAKQENGQSGVNGHSDG